MDEVGELKFQIIAGEPAVDFVNTLDNRPVPERLKELLNSYEELIDWATQSGLMNPAQRSRLLQAVARNNRGASAALSHAIVLRECLFRIFTDVAAGRAPSKGDLQTLNGYLGEAMSHLQLKASGKALRLDWEEAEDPPLESVLWPIARSASELLTSGDLKYLRECSDDTCRWMFVDRSKNHSRRWCDMKVCGNRVKVRRFYRRQRRAR